MDRQEIVGVVTAVSEWFAMDHEERLLIAGGKLGIIEDAVGGLSTVNSTSIAASDNYMAISLNVTLDIKTLGKDAPEVSKALDSMNPRVRVDAIGDDSLVLVLTTLEPESSCGKAFDNLGSSPAHTSAPCLAWRRAKSTPPQFLRGQFVSMQDRSVGIRYTGKPHSAHAHGLVRSYRVHSVTSAIWASDRERHQADVPQTLRN